MDYAPSIDWPLAFTVSTVGARDLPDLSAPELRRLVADLRVTARRAGGLVAERLGLDAPGATDIRVVDWAGWGRAMRSMIDAAVGEFDLSDRPDGALTRLRATGNGIVVGAGIRLAARRLLGQFDAYTGSGRLYLVAPTIVAHERRHGFVAADFRLWICLHEQTHALQFRAAPWLRGWLAERARAVFDDDTPLLPGILGWARTGDLASLVSGAGDGLAEVVAAMTFLEGHADHTADSIGYAHVPTVRTLRKAFTRPEGATGLGRLSASFDKSAQYRDGLRFCERVTAARGRHVLMRAFAEPGNLPRPGEIAEPRLWLGRVGG